MAKIRFNTLHTKEVTRKRDPEDVWDQNDISHDYSINGFQIVENDNLISQYYDLEIPFEPESNKTYYLLYVRYSTGDTFHHEDGCIEYMDLYFTMQDAEENAKKIQESSKKTNECFKNPDYWSVTLTDAVGNVHKMSAPWKGYFEHLESVEIEAISLKEKRSYKL